MGLSRQLRLKRAEDFARLRKQGRVCKHPMLTLSYMPNGLPHNRYGFVTSKHLGKAVVRNRARRLLREVVRKLHERLKPGFDIVVIVREQMIGQPISVVEQTTLELLQRSTLLTDKE